MNNDNYTSEDSMKTLDKLGLLDEKPSDKKVEPVQALTFIKNPSERLAKTFDEKNYLLLIEWDDENHEQAFEVIKGRTEARARIINLVQAGDVAIHDSFVLVDGIKNLDIIEDRITFYECMKRWEPSFDDGFDIEEYNFRGDGEVYDENGKLVGLNVTASKSKEESFSEDLPEQLMHEDQVFVFPLDDGNATHEDI